MQRSSECNAWKLHSVMVIERIRKRMADKMNSSINYFHPETAVIDDDMNEFAAYFIAMDYAIKVLSEKKEYFPLQLDLWIIPKNAVSNVASAEEDGKDDDEDDVDFHGDQDDEAEEGGKETSKGRSIQSLQ